MVLREIEKLKQEDSDRQKQEKLKAEQLAEGNKVREQASRLRAQQEAIARKQDYEQRRAKLQAYFQRIGVLEGLEELKQVDKIKYSKKTALLINPDSNTATFVWGNKFAVEDDRIVPENTGIFGQVWEKDYEYIDVEVNQEKHMLIVHGVSKIEVGETNLQGLQRGIAQVLLSGPNFVKTRSTPKDRREEAEAARNYSPPREHN